MSKSLNQLKAEYEAVMRQAEVKQNNLNRLQQEKSKLQNDQSKLAQISTIDAQIQTLNNQITRMQPGLNQLKAQQDKANLELAQQQATNNNLKTEISSVLANTAKYDAWFKDIDKVLNDLSDITGKKIDTTAMVVKILAKTVPEELKNTKAIEEACIKQSKEALEILLKKLDDINAVDSNGMTLVMHALKHGFWQGVDRLLELGADVNIVDNNGCNALMYICTMPHMKYMERIIDLTKNLATKTYKEGDTALHLLCKNSGISTIWSDELLLIKQHLGSDKESMYVDGGSIVINNSVSNLVIGTRSDGYSDNQRKSFLICKKLKAKGADFSILNHGDLSPYFYLCRNQQKYLAKCLEDEGVVDLNLLDDNGFQGAAGKLLLRDHSDLKAFINTHPSCFEGFDANGDSLLHFAVQMQDKGLVQLLVDSGANINIKNLANGRTPLFLACASKQAEIVKYLLSKSPDLSITDNNGFDIFLWASELGDCQLMQNLISRGCDINIQDNFGKTTLFWMIQYGYGNVIDWLLANGADPNIPNANGEHPIGFCVSQNNINIFNKLLNHNITDINSRSSQYKVTALWLACQDGKMNFVEALMAKGANANIPREDTGLTPAHIALARGHKDIMFKIIKSGINLNAQDAQKFSLLHYAVQLHDLDLTKQLIDYGVNKDLPDTLGRTAVYWSCLQGQKEILECLITKGANVNALNSPGFHPIHGAAHNGHIEIIKSLVSHGVDIDQESQSGMTALYYSIACVSNINKDLIKYFIDSGSDLSKHNTDQGFTVLYAAVQKGDNEIIDLLIASGASPTQAISSTGDTPIAMAAFAGKLDILQKLESLGSSINTTNKKGDMPIHESIMGGHIDVIEYLLSKGVDINVKGGDGKTPLCYLLENKELSSKKKLTIIKHFSNKLDLNISIADEAGKTVESYIQEHSPKLSDYISDSSLLDAFDPAVLGSGLSEEEVPVLGGI